MSPQKMADWGYGIRIALILSVEVSLAVFIHLYCGRAAMNEAALKKRLEELSEVLTLLHRISEGEDPSVHHTSLTGASLEEILDYLRLQVKYVVFDLEATRRENGYLRRMLETRQKPNDEDTSPPKW